MIMKNKLNNTWSAYSDKLVTYRCIERMIDFGFIKSALCFFSLPFFLILFIVPTRTVGAGELLFVSILLGLPGLFLEMIALVCFSFFEFMGTCIMSLAWKE